jgi:lysophospholipase L1-like esterase
MHDLKIQHNQKIVLIGDSITDCGRRDSAAPYGDGYVSILRDIAIAGWPERDITWVNKGIGGDTVVNLRARWQQDVIDEKPDWLTIKIGINDLGCYLSGVPEAVAPPVFREVYEEILTRATTEITPHIVLITPFYMSTDRSGTTAESRMLDLLPEYLTVVEQMATQFGLPIVHLQPVFERQLAHRPASAFCAEPVHPNRTGHTIIALELLKALLA